VGGVEVCEAMATLGLSAGYRPQDVRLQQASKPGLNVALAVYLTQNPALATLRALSHAEIDSLGLLVPYDREMGMRRLTHTDRLSRVWSASLRYEPIGSSFLLRSTP